MSYELVVEVLKSLIKKESRPKAKADMIAKLKELEEILK